MPDAYENFNIAMQSMLTASVIADDEDPNLPFNDLISTNVLSPFNGSQGNMSSMSSASPLSTSLSPISFSPEDYINLNSVTILGEPYIEILVQPAEKFRFRYKSEMVGTHGSLQGASLSTNRRNKYNVPTVKLCNYMDNAIIRCTLVTSDDNRILHAHKLVKRVNNEDIDDPHDILVSQSNDYTAEFMSMGIIHTAKKYIKEEIVRKLRAELLEERRRFNINATLSLRDDAKIKADAEQYQKSMNLNSVTLCFQAFIKDDFGIMKSITERVYSHPINNLKSALFGELKICRIDKITGSCEGGEEVFIFVEKVAKKNIRIKFFEMNEDEVEVWCDYARFSELDVHHQYAIAFRTPPYKDLTITSPKSVFIQLERSSDLHCSNVIDFTYKPSDRMISRKRQRVSNSNSEELAQMAVRTAPSMINSSTVSSTQLINMPSSTGAENIDISTELNKILEERCSSTEFKEFFANMSSDDGLRMYVDFYDQSEKLTCDGPRSKAANVTSDDDKLFANEILYTVMRNIKLKPEKAKDAIQISLRDRTTYGDTPLHCALRYGQWNTAKNILKLISIVKSDAADLMNIQNSSGKTPLHYAVIQDHPEITRALLMLGADPNVADHCGQMPLHRAAKFPEAKANVHILLNEKTVNIEANTDLGWTPLQLAAEAGSYYAVCALVKAGADVNSTDMSYGRTALHAAVEGGHTHIVKFLLENTKIDVNKRNFSGNTALHSAVVTPGLIAKEICLLLLKHGADPYIKNYHNESEMSNIEEDDECIKIKTEALSDDEIEECNGQSSFDLASSKPDILQLVSGESAALLKEAVECKEEDINDSEKVWMKVDQETQLACILDKTRGWRKLLRNFEFDDLMSTFESSTSPSMLLLNCIAIQTSTSLSELQNILEIIGEDEAAEFMRRLLQKN